MSSGFSVAVGEGHLVSPLGIVSQEEAGVSCQISCPLCALHAQLNLLLLLSQPTGSC